MVPQRIRSRFLYIGAHDVFHWWQWFDIVELLIVYKYCNIVSLWRGFEWWPKRK